MRKRRERNKLAATRFLFALAALLFAVIISLAVSIHFICGVFCLFDCNAQFRCREKKRARLDEMVKSFIVKSEHHHHYYDEDHHNYTVSFLFNPTSLAEATNLRRGTVL